MVEACKDKFSLEQLEREVTCGICQEHYTDPKILPCLHCYCKQCVLKLALRKGIEKPFYCPECRCTITLPEEGVEGLKSAFFINRFKSTFTTLQRAHGKVEVSCEACSEDKAESFCRQCAMFICKMCTDSHLRMKSVFLNHQVVSLQDLKEGRAKATITEIEPSPQKCPGHNEDMKVFCYDCNSIICRDCTVVDHKDHKFQFCKIATPKVIEDLKKEMEPLKEIGSTLTRAVVDIKTTREQVEAQGMGVTQTINTSFDEIVQIVEQRRKELLEEAGRRVQEKVDKLTVQEKTLSLANAEVQSVIDYTERCVNHCSDNEVMSMHKDLKGKIVRTREQFDEQSPSTIPGGEADLGVDVCSAGDINHIFKSKRGVFQVPLSACTVEGKGLKKIEVGQVAQLTLINHRMSSEVSSELKCLHNESVIKCVVDQSGPGKYLIQYTPTVRGRHELTVSVDGRHIVGSPFPVFVSIHPSQLGKSVEVWNDLDKPSDIVINSKEELIISKQSESAIVSISKNSRRRIDLELDGVYVNGLEVDNEDFLYLTLADCTSLYKLTAEGSIILHTQAKHCIGHLGIAVVEKNVMVCPLHSQGTIIVYTRELKFKRKIRKENMGQLRDISSDSHGNLYVSDRDRFCIRVLTNRGNYLYTIENSASMIETLTRPLGLCVSGQFVYICNNGQATDNHSIYVFTLEGKFVTKYGIKGKADGQFDAPVNICSDQDGFFYVSDYLNNRIQKF